MNYLFILTQVEGAWADAPAGEAERVLQQYMALERELEEQGKLRDSGRLRPSAEAKTIRNLPDGRRTVRDGPYGDGEEMMGGYYVIDCA
ncbi:MAG TPA: YciI family protein, partial [Candidatus Dormibacteraeota bacterium]|nr:YciI family protein [Candidatus Dormibacteraeota bacterium]